jgi:sigma-B regulation protein RsbU (phosphoserine phosphatase)
MFAASEFETGQVSLQPSDVLILYSDGITEAATASGEEFGEERLQTVVSDHLQETPIGIQKHVLEAVRKWSPKEPEDDMTLVIVRAAQLSSQSGATDLKVNALGQEAQ